MQDTITTTFTSPDLEAARARLERELDTGIVFDKTNPNCVHWAARKALAWGKLVPSDPGQEPHVLVEVTQALTDVEFVTPVLTPDKVTAENAVDLKPVGSVSGTCTREHPWGGQCTGILPDGTPVPTMKFKADVLKVIAGRKTAEQVCDEWLAEVTRCYRTADRGQRVIGGDLDG